VRARGRRAVDRHNTAAGLLLLLLAALVSLSLFTHSAEDLGGGWEVARVPENASGVVGAYVSGALFRTFGPLGAWGIPALLLVWGWNRLRKAPARRLATRCVLAFALGATSLGLLSIWSAREGGAWGGRLGEAIAGLGSSLFGSWGVHFVLWAIFLAILLAISEWPLRLVSYLRGPLVWSIRALASVPGRVAGWVKRARARRAKAIVARLKSQMSAAPVPAADELRSRPRVVSGGPVIPEEPGPAFSRAVLRVSTPEGSANGARKERATPQSPAIEGARGDGAAGYDLPPLSLLGAPEGSGGGVNEDEVLEASNTLQEALAHFGVRGKVGEVHPGPVITRYDFEPSPGIKVNQILSRQDDISLALRCQGIRIVAPIPGKAAVGIEVPNKSPQVVYLKELLSRPEFNDEDSKLTLALGKTVAGDPYFADLASMPHLLIAGATGSGKSVCVNSIIVSLLYRLTADELKFLLIDPKRLELSGYNGIPHLLLPVVTDHKKAAGALRWVVHEMERRYKRLAAAGSRDIASFNAKAGQGTLGVTGAGGPAVSNEALGSRGREVLGDRAEGRAGEETGGGRLPYLVIVIDELADLMVALPVEIEEPVTRLAQMARAVGIHLILATQRPSVDVITGLIKANFPCRIAFQVAAKVDSRTILDTNGAECLMGRGDMLFLSGGSPQPVRIHAPYVSPEDTARVTSFLCGQATADEEVETGLDLDESGWDDAAADEEIFKEAAKIVVLHQQGSTSLLQRRLRIGYSRAARIVDMLEQRGIVGPFKGSKAREVLVDEEYLKENRLM
jgi:S-DNA-T family DNA segregation ATPase FtsK/SpoIIIE